MEMNQPGQSSSHIRESCLLALVWKANSPVLKTLHKEAGGVTVVSLVVNQPESNGITFGFAVFLHLMLTFYSWFVSLGTKKLFG